MRNNETICGEVDTAAIIMGVFITIMAEICSVNKLMNNFIITSWLISVILCCLVWNFPFSYKISPEKWDTILIIKSFVTILYYIAYICGLIGTFILFVKGL